MVNSWGEKAIEDLPIHIGDGNYSNKYPRSKDFVEQGIPFISAGDLVNGRISSLNLRYISEEQHATLLKGHLKKGDVLITTRGWIGNVAFVTDDFHGSNINAQLVLMRADNKVINNKYLYYLLSTKEYKQLFLAYSSGSAQPQLPIKALKLINIRYPDVIEQKAIAHILGTLDDKIELNRQMNETLEAMAQALFQSWFVDFDPVIDNALLAGNDIPDELAERAELRQAQLDSGKAKTNSEVNDLFPSEFEFTEELGWIPKGWSVKGFSHLAKLDTTSVKPNLEPEKIWEHYSIPAFDVDESPVFDLGETIKSNKYKVDKNAILVSKLNPETERIWWVDIEDEESAICSTEFMQFIPKEVKHRGYIYNLVRSYPFQVEILSRVTGSTGSRQRAQPKSVAEIAVVIPNTELIDKFSEISGNLKSKVSGNISQNTKLAKLRDTLLPKLMSGELRIPDAEKLAENI